LTETCAVYIIVSTLKQFCKNEFIKVGFKSTGQSEKNENFLYAYNLNLTPNFTLYPKLSPHFPITGNANVHANPVSLLITAKMKNYSYQGP